MVWKFDRMLYWAIILGYSYFFFWMKQLEEFSRSWRWGARWRYVATIFSPQEPLVVSIIPWTIFLHARFSHKAALWTAEARFLPHLTLFECKPVVAANPSVGVSSKPTNDTEHKSNTGHGGPELNKPHLAQTTPPISKATIEPLKPSRNNHPLQCAALSPPYYVYSW